MSSTFVTREGSRWMPDYLSAIDGTTSIGCGRCFKVGQHLYGVDDAGEILGACDGSSTATSIA